MTRDLLDQASPLPRLRANHRRGGVEDGPSSLPKTPRGYRGVNAIGRFEFRTITSHRSFPSRIPFLAASAPCLRREPTQTRTTRSGRKPPCVAPSSAGKGAKADFRLPVGMEIFELHTNCDGVGVEWRSSTSAVESRFLRMRGASRATAFEPLTSNQLSKSNSLDQRCHPCARVASSWPLRL